MKYGEIQQYYKDRIFHTNDGDTFDVTRVKAIGDNFVEMTDGYSMRLNKINVDDLRRALCAVKKYYDMLITELDGGVSNANSCNNGGR